MDSATATATATTQWQDEEAQQTKWNIHPERSLSRMSKGYEHGHDMEGADDGGVTVKTDIVVQVDDGRSTSSGDARLLPSGGEMSVVRDGYGYRAR